jgi:hypothetical protein
MGKRETTLEMLQCFQNIVNTRSTYRSPILGPTMVLLDDGKQRELM